MLDIPFGDAAVEIVRSARPTSGPVLIASLGGYGGQFAAKFEHPFDVYASAICGIALFAGVMLAIVAAIPPVIRSWSRPNVH